MRSVHRDQHNWHPAGQLVLNHRTSSRNQTNRTNQDSSDRTYRVAITDASGAASGEDWVHYDFPIAANMSHKFTLACGDGDTIRVQASVADLISFVLTGLKVT